MQILPQMWVSIYSKIFPLNSFKCNSTLIRLDITFLKRVDCFPARCGLHRVARTMAQGMTRGSPPSPIKHFFIFSYSCSWPQSRKKKTQVWDLCACALAKRMLFYRWFELMVPGVHCPVCFPQCMLWGSPTDGMQWVPANLLRPKRSWSGGRVPAGWILAALFTRSASQWLHPNGNFC